MIKRSLISVSVASLSLLAFLFAGPAADAQRHGLTADVTLNQPVFLPGEDLLVNVRIVNHSGQSLALGEGQDWITFSIAGPGNVEVATKGSMPVAKPFTLPSGDMANVKFNPAPFYDLSQPGRYTIKATVKVAQWDQKFVCAQIVFTVERGAPLSDFPGLEFGMATDAGVTNAIPETRRYDLLKVTSQDEIKLYFRLSGPNGKVLRCYSVGRMLSFSVPEAKMDRFNNLHLLWQYSARDFSYLVITTSGDLLLRETHVYTETRPHLKASERNIVSVHGGVRKYTPWDIPSVVSESANK